MKFAVALLPLVLLLACDKKTATPPSEQASASIVAPASPSFVLTAKEINAAYKQNEVAADDKFKGKQVQVSGIIGEIGKNAFDQMYVSIKTDMESMDLQGAFEDKHKSALAALKAGQPVKIVGEVSGLIVGGVTLKDCQIVP